MTTLKGSFTLRSVVRKKRAGRSCEQAGPLHSSGTENQFTLVEETELLAKFGTQTFLPSNATAKGPLPVA